MTVGPTLEDSLNELELASHNVRREVTAKQQSDKGTSKSYSRHYKSYMLWWSMDQQEKSRESTGCIPIPAEPITVAKVALFLNHEAKRPKVCSYQFSALF